MFCTGPCKSRSVAALRPLPIPKGRSLHHHHGTNIRQLVSVWHRHDDGDTVAQGAHENFKDKNKQTFYFGEKDTRTTRTSETAARSATLLNRQDPEDRKITRVKIDEQSQKDGVDEEEDEDEYEYKPPVFSSSFQTYIDSMTPKETGNEGGVSCTGEPSIDPSRRMQNFGGVDSEWLADVSEENAAS